MKKIKYPAEVKVKIDRETGKILDKHAKKEPCSRPSVLLKALRFFDAHSVTTFL